MKIDNAKFKKKVVPGDNLIFRLNLISPIEEDYVTCGKGFVNGQIVVEADLLAQISLKTFKMHQPLAYIDSNADIARNVVIEPFVTIEKDVVIGKGTWIGSNVTIMEGARIGENCRIFPAV